jgi:5'-deoxynucleotidase YfbR-like HD superfamily hydrolase
MDAGYIVMNSPMQHLAIFLQQYLAVSSDDMRLPEIPLADIEADISFIYKLYEMQKLVRFFGQRYWENETTNNILKPGELGLETVAAHSFQVASSVRWLAPHFPWLDPSKAVDLALVHDQPEILIGDRDPVGLDGRGSDTHAFNPKKRAQKESDERAALAAIVEGLRHSMQKPYRALVEEFLDGRSNEALFVKSVDKLQALAFVRLKKKGNIIPDHMAFTLRYSRLGVLHFPSLQPHFQNVIHDVLRDVLSEAPASFNEFCKKTKDILEEDNV